MMNKTINTILTISIIIFIILTATLLTALNKNNLQDKMQKAGSYKTLGQEKAEHLLDNTLNFLNNEEPLTNNFTQKEQSHMKDVKNIFNAIRWIELTTFILIIIISARLITKKQTKQLIKSIKQSTTIILLTATTILLLILLNFQQTFNLFHKIFFPQGNWAFPYNSTLITLFPQEFFVSISTQIFLLIIGISITLLGASILLSHPKKKTQQKNKTKQKKEKII